MAKKESKKPEWMRPHICIHCKKQADILLCSNCGKVSVKVTKK